MNLTQRSTDLEIMDDLACSGEVVNQTLRELEFINRWLGGNRVTLVAVRELLQSRKSMKSAPVSIVDLGCGGGDMLKHIADLGRRLGIPMKLLGIDANPNIIGFAIENCSDYPEIMFETANVLSEDFAARSYDIVVGTLFFHHFDDSTLITLLSQLRKQVRVGIVINDIHRHWLAYHSIRLLTRLFSSSSMVRFDAPLSVRRAFRRSEWESLLAGAGASKFTIRWKWAFRWQIQVPAT
jgi:2-polyprenyl-3-methyl-5-hydroxy-6-metoxy-1,4-benzoquinol methylase